MLSRQKKSSQSSSRSFQRHLSVRDLYSDIPAPFTSSSKLPNSLFFLLCNQLGELLLPGWKSSMSSTVQLLPFPPQVHLCSWLITVSSACREETEFICSTHPLQAQLPDCPWLLQFSPNVCSQPSLTFIKFLAIKSAQLHRMTHSKRVVES